jgi:16S rRNA (cytosine1402-N4)-methyltransferase
LTIHSQRVYYRLKWEKVVISGNLVKHKGLLPAYHIPVLADEVVAWLQCQADGVYLDCTVGSGALAARILEAAGRTARLIGIDQDPSAVEAARERLRDVGGRIDVVLGNFEDLKVHMASVGVSHVNGVIFDLGISSAQLDRPERGFSFLADGPLDMRMDPSRGRPAAELVNLLPEQDLADVIYRYGQERYSRRIARAIIRNRAVRPLRSTSELVSVIRAAVPAAYRHGRIHVATRTFQALRIAVNRELEILEGALRDAADVLAPGGRLCVISFHSLEDRIVKRTFKVLSSGPEALLSVATKKPVIPSEAERQDNPRARSAKLRVAERLPERRLS